MKYTTGKQLKLHSAVYLADIVTFNVAIFICYLLNFWPIMYYSKSVLIFDFVLANVAYILALLINRIELHKRMKAPYHVIKNSAYTSVLVVLLYDAFLGMTHFFVSGYFRSLIIMAIVFLCMCFERLSIRKLLANYRESKGNLCYTVFVGMGYNVLEVLREMKQPWTGYSVRGYFNDTEVASEEYDLRYLGTVDQVLDYLENNGIDEIYIGLPDRDDARMLPVVKHCEHNMVKVFYVPESHSTNMRHTYPKEFGTTYVMAMYKEPLQSLKNRFIKRAFDLFVSTLFLCTLYPFIYLIVALVTKITMPGPVYFKQKRTGYDGKDFMMVKFRSMKVNSEADDKQATKDDERITKWGRFLRHSSIDELPQFINVFRGEMSVVGPRPHMRSHTEYYSARISNYMIRHYVKPGITGWAQSHGSRGETKELKDMERRVKKDIWYIEHWSLWLDIQIIVKTVRDAIMGDPQAY